MNHLCEAKFHLTVGPGMSEYYSDVCAIHVHDQNRNTDRNSRGKKSIGTWEKHDDEKEAGNVSIVRRVPVVP